MLHLYAFYVAFTPNTRAIIRSIPFLGELNGPVPRKLTLDSTVPLWYYYTYEAVLGQRYRNLLRN